jgi:hypothetical protein
MRLLPEVYTNEYEPWYGVLVSEAESIAEAQQAVVNETMHGLPIRYLGVRTEAILNENGRPGRRRRFHVFTDEPA